MYFIRGQQYGGGGSDHFLLLVTMVIKTLYTYSDVSAALALDLAVDRVLKTITYPMIAANTLTLWNSVQSQRLVRCHVRTHPRHAPGNTPNSRLT